MDCNAKTFKYLVSHTKWVYLSQIYYFFSWHNWLVLLDLCWHSIRIRSYWCYIYLLLSPFPTCFSSHTIKAVLLYSTGQDSTKLHFFSSIYWHPLLPYQCQQLRTKDDNMETRNHYPHLLHAIFRATLATPGRILFKMQFMRSITQTNSQTNCSATSLSQVLGHILFGMSLTAWKSRASFITLCHSLVAATWITRIT